MNNTIHITLAVATVLFSIITLTEESAQSKIKLDIGGVPQDLELQLSLSPWKVDIAPLHVEPVTIHSAMFVDCALLGGCLSGLYLFSQSLVELVRSRHYILGTSASAAGLALAYACFQELLKRNGLELRLSQDGAVITERSTDS